MSWKGVPRLWSRAQVSGSVHSASGQRESSSTSCTHASAIEGIEEVLERLAVDADPRASVGTCMCKAGFAGDGSGDSLPRADHGSGQCKAGFTGDDDSGCDDDHCCDHSGRLLQRQYRQLLRRQRLRKRQLQQRLRRQRRVTATAGTTAAVTTVAASTAAVTTNVVIIAAVRATAATTAAVTTTAGTGMCKAGSDR